MNKFNIEDPKEYKIFKKYKNNPANCLNKFNIENPNEYKKFKQNKKIIQLIIYLNKFNLEKHKKILKYAPLVSKSFIYKQC